MPRNLTPFIMTRPVMHHLAGAHLLRHAPLPFAVHAADAPADGALLLVETRPSFFLPHVVASAARTHPRWRLYVVATPAVHALLSKHCTNYHDVTRVDIHVGSLSTEEFSRLMLSRALWDLVREEHVLVFQSDCVLVRGTPPAFLEFDYVGPVCGSLDARRFVMNGGLSLRRTKAMRRAVDLLRARHPDLMAQPEDAALCEAMRREGDFRLPTLDQCNAFGIETVGDPDTAVGVHGVDKYYAPDDLLARLLRG